MSLVAPVAYESAGSGVAVDVATHDVYVADTGNRRVDEFEADGTFVRAFGWGVADGEAKLEVCTGVSGCRAGLSGSSPGEFVTPLFVAVDNDPGSASYGDVYVGDMGDLLVSKFTSEGVLVGSWGDNGAGGEPNGQLSRESLRGVAVDGSGRLWVMGINGGLFEFSEAGVSVQTCLNLPDEGNLLGLAVDGSDGLYAGGGGGFNTVVKFASGCAALGLVASNDKTGLAVDAVSNDLYVDAEGALIEDIPLAECVPGPHPCVADQLFGGEGEGPEGKGVLDGGAGVAVDPGSGLVYVANTVAGQIVGFAPAVAATAGAPGEVLAHSAMLHGKVNPEGVELSRCRFEYGEGEAFDHSVPCEEGLSAIGAGSSPVDVQAKAEGLVGGTSYRFRVRATSTHGDVRSESEPFTTLPVAVIEAAASSGLKKEAGGDVSVSLSANVNPENVAGTTCQIEYGTSTAYGTTVPCESATLTGNTSVAVSAHLAGLSQAKTYHWRVVARDENGAAESADHTFVYLTETPVRHGCASEAVRGESDLNPGTGRALSLALPDCRAYELVTPPFKNGALTGTGFGIFPWAVAEGGSRVLVQSIQCFDSAPSCVVSGENAVAQPFSLERGSAGWVPEPLAPPLSYTKDVLRLYNADTGNVLYTLAEGEGGQERFYVRRLDGTFETIGPTAELPQSIGSFAFTRNLSHLAYTGGADLWPSLDAGSNTVYEYATSGAAHPELAGVTGGPGSTSLVSACGSVIGNGVYFPGPGSLSSDGRVLYFDATKCLTGSGENLGIPVLAGELYARIDGSRTVKVSASAPEPQCGVACQAEPPGDARFEGASEDGSRAFFTSTRRLTNEASEDNHKGDTAGGDRCSETAAVASGCNLYEFECPSDCENPAAKRLVDVSAPMAAGEAPRVQGVMAVSADGSHVYFVARGVLTPGANSDGREPLEGGENLYVYERDSGHPEGQLSFVGTLSASDASEVDAGDGSVTPDGRYLVFTSHRALTPDVTRVEGPAQVYRYDAQAQALVRVSAGEQGFNDNGNNGTVDARIVATVGSLKAGGRRDPTMSDDGRFVFFESPVGLTPGALNDVQVTGDSKVLAENVYEWEAAGSGGCEESGGCVSLISDGRDVTEGSNTHYNASVVELVGVDATGENVFFETADQLVGQDTDTQVDFYDARVGGGFAAPAPAAACDAGETLAGEACSHPGSTGGVFGAPGSLTFSGPGNTLVEGKVVGSPAPRLGSTRAQKLKRALVACRKRYRSRGRHTLRVVCERSARRRYGSLPRRGGRASRPHAVKGGRG